MQVCTRTVSCSSRLQHHRLHGAPFLHACATLRSSRLPVLKAPAASSHTTQQALTTSEAGPASRLTSRVSSLPDLQPGQVAYFAYGSNMNPKVLSGTRAVTCVASLPAKLPGWTLGFHLSSLPYVEPGMGTIEQAFAARVSAGLHGVVHVISSEGWEKVKRTEGVGVKGRGYQVIEVPVELYDGRQVTAVTLQAASASCGGIDQFLPSNRYINLLREGARVSGVDPAYCDMLDQHPAYQREEGLRGSVGKVAVVGLMAGVVLGMAPLVLLSAAQRSVFPPGQGSSTSEPKPSPPRENTASSTNTPNGNSTSSRGTSDQANKAPLSTSSSLAPSAEESSSLLQRVRRAADPRLLMATYTMAISVVWAAHDSVLKHVAGNGSNNNDRVSAGASNAQR